MTSHCRLRQLTTEDKLKGTHDLRLTADGAVSTRPSALIFYKCCVSHVRPLHFTSAIRTSCFLPIARYKDILHGDLICKNVRVDDQGKAYITEFGLSILKANFDSTHYITSTFRGATRYPAPELLSSNAVAVLDRFTPVLAPACDTWSGECHT